MTIIGNKNIRYSGTQARDTRESVLDAVIDLAPMQVPLIAMATRGPTPDNIKHEWLVDYSGAYPDTVSGLTRGEGEDANPAATAARVMMFNRTHNWGRSWSVTDTQQAVRKFGIESEFDFQAVKHSRLTVRDFEYLLHHSVIDVDSAAPNTGTAGLKRKMGGLRDMIYDTDAGSGTYVSEGTLATGASGKNSAATATMVVSDITGIHSTIWARGGVPNGVTTCLLAAAGKQAVSRLFSPVNTTTTIHRRTMGGLDDMTFNLPVERVITEFGELHLVLDQSMKTTEMIGFDPEFFEINVLRDFSVIELGITGDSKHGLVVAEMTCSLLSPNTGFLLTAVD